MTLGFMPPKKGFHVKQREQPCTTIPLEGVASPPFSFSTSRVDCDADQPARGLRHEQAEGKDNEVEEEEGGGDDAYQLGGRAEGHESGSGRGGHVQPVLHLRVRR